MKERNLARMIELNNESDPTHANAKLQDPIEYDTISPVSFNKIESLKEEVKYLTDVYWDTDVNPDQLYSLFRGDIERIGHIDRINLYRRLFMTYDWYTLLSLIPPDRLREALSAPVLDRLYPKSLKDRYLYAKSVLFG